MTNYFKGLSHGEVCPKNILINEQLQVYLRPFKLDLSDILSISYPINGQEKYNAKFWYCAPELLFSNMNSLEKENLMSTKGSTGTLQPFENNEVETALDMWSVGCIFSELFLTLTPLFQAVDQLDQFNKLVEVFFFLLLFFSEVSSFQFFC